MNKVKIVVERYELLPSRTIGRLFASKTSPDGQPLDCMFCYTLEDTVRGMGKAETVQDWKIKNETAIPYGTYPARVGMSPKRGYDVIWVGDKEHPVPGFTDIQFHKGNTQADSSGCILVGEWINEQTMALVNSTVAFNRLMDFVKDCTITVSIQ